MCQLIAKEKVFARSTVLDQAIERAVKALLSLQDPHGYWSFELLVDILTVSDYLLYYYWRGKVDKEKQHRIVQHLLKSQLEDGGWALYEGGPSEVNLTVKGYLVLKLAGYNPEDPLMKKIRQTALRLGGVNAMNTYSKLMLALLGLYPWDALPAIPIEMVLLPPRAPFSIYDLSSWTRNMVVPLALISYLRPIRPLPERYRIDELYLEEISVKNLRPKFDERLLSWRNCFLLFDRIYKLYDKLSIQLIRKKAVQVAERWILARIGEGSDGMGAIFPAMVYTLIALEALGYDESHPLFAKELKDLQDLEVADPQDNSLRVRPCFSPTWDTAMAIIALTKAGVPRNNPQIIKAVDWLLSKEIRVFGDWYYKNPYPEASGWAFEFNNTYYPDVDDTAMVLLALSQGSSSNEDHKQQAIKRATGWLRSFQCKNGGFAAFDKDVTKKWLEKVPYADHNAVLDPPCADITGRVLEWLGRAGYTTTDPVAARAIQFLKNTQLPDGSWQGRWGVNYIYGTWQALRGLASIGVNMNEQWIQHALDWLQSCQNPDGGWGETAFTDWDPTQKGKGESDPVQTAWAIMGLIAGGRGENCAVKRAVDYLIRTQREDGTWVATNTNGIGFPRVYYLQYDVYRYVWPLLALAEYKDLLK